MAHSGGRIYTDANSGISIISDIKSVLSSNKNGIGAIIKNSTINKWAKYKPVRSSKKKALTASERQATSYGVNINKYINPATLISSLLGEYAYQKPRGATTYREYYRELDFNGYNSGAECPIDDFSGPTGNVYTGQNVMVALSINTDAPTGSLALSDLYANEVAGESTIKDTSKSLANYYFGVIVKTGNVHKVLTLSTTIAQHNTSEITMSLPAEMFSEGSGNTYSIYPIFSYREISSISTSGAYREGLCAVPNTSPCTFTLQNASTQISYGIVDDGLTAWMSVGKLHYSITGRLLTSNPGGLAANVFYRLYAGQDTSGLLLEEGQFYYGQVTTSGVTQEITGNVSTSNPEYVTAVLVYQEVPSPSKTAEVSEPSPE